MYESYRRVGQSSGMSPDKGLLALTPLLRFAPLQIRESLGSPSRDGRVVFLAKAREPPIPEPHDTAKGERDDLKPQRRADDDHKDHEREEQDGSE